jgi:hypothetical protein
MTLERPMSLQAILRNERRRIIWKAIQDSFPRDGMPFESMASIAARLKVPVGEVYQVMNESLIDPASPPQHAQ